MDTPMNNLHFKFMSFGYLFRDLGHPPLEKVREAGIQPGVHVLDYGCGPGSFAIAAAELTGETGKVYAVDIHPLALESVQKRAAKKGLNNIETIQSDCKTGLKTDTVDVVLLYDILHVLTEPENVLEELHRILKPTGILSLSDPHMKEEEMLSRIPERLFTLAKKGKRTHTFSPV